MTIPEGFAQVTVEYTGNGAPTGAANVFGVEITNPAFTPASVAAQVSTVWSANIMTQLTDDVTMSNIRVKFGPDDTGPFDEVTASDAGGNATTSLTPNTAYLATKSTALGGRRGRGRMYFPGVADTAADDGGNVSGGYLALLQPLLDGIIEDLDSAGIPMVVLHSPATVWALVDGQPRRVPLPGPVPSPDAVTALTLAPKVATQRRRLRR